jgi:hypothetical protein
MRNLIAGVPTMADKFAEKVAIITRGLDRYGFSHGKTIRSGGNG